MFPAYILSNIFSAQGDTKTPMKINISALILNAILDPIFIYTFKLGIKGAAIATVISFLFSLILGIYYIKRKSYLYIHKSSFKFSLEILKDIIKVGAPASLMMIFMSIYVIFLNLFMIKFGTNYVAAFGIATRLESVAMMPVVAFSLSTMTLIGMFYGAKRYDLVKNITWYSIKICLTIASSVGLIFLIFPSLFIKIFTAETALISIGSAYLRIDVFTFPLMAFSILVSKAMQGMGYGLPGLVINLIRVFIVSVPLAYLFVNILNYGFLSIAVAMVIGGLSSVIVGFIWLESKFLKLKKKKTNLSN